MKKLFFILFSILLLLTIVTIIKAYLFGDIISLTTVENRTQVFPLKQSQHDAVADHNWYYNTRFGLKFETPKSVQNIQWELPDGGEEYVNKAYYYTYGDNEIVITQLIMDTKFKTYDTQVGLKGAVSNVVNSKGGTDLHLDFYDIENEFNDQGCKGEFIWHNLHLQVRGYCYFRNDGMTHILVGYGGQNEVTNAKLNRVFSSIEILN